MPALEEAGMKFGQKLKELREQAGLSQPDLAEKCGLSVWTLRGWEQGRRLPNCKATLLLLKVLGVCADAFDGCEDLQEE